ncbi:hypothetical protein IQ07DRAFT_587529 [Pyrenochaeta sp. DS3sAY3a]|nr:hypothetical protein IQ07DRAFT_587529 [Pyrenochaeta sp. DS3sAY3a]
MSTTASIHQPACVIIAGHHLLPPCVNSPFETCNRPKGMSKRAFGYRETVHRSLQEASEHNRRDPLIRTITLLSVMQWADFGDPGWLPSVHSVSTCLFSAHFPSHSQPRLHAATSPSQVRLDKKTA